MTTPLWIKFVMVAALAAIVFSLGLALWRLISDRGDSERTVRALSFRIGLSLVLFLLLMLGMLTGVVVPHGVVP
ncbi:MAG: twin transmembrane helix small protein [Rhodocyclales bacterium]|nr:twin transmembrane helix small protein [Rhodocyclales bacterium]